MSASEHNQPPEDLPLFVHTWDDYTLEHAADCRFCALLAGVDEDPRFIHIRMDNR